MTERLTPGKPKYADELPEQTIFPNQCVRVRKDGTRCKMRPIVGGTVCYRHGGAAPGIRAKAERRVAAQNAIAAATREIERLGLPDRTPLEHLEAVLEADARSFAIWNAACAALVEDGDTLLSRDKHDALSIHPYVDERNKAAQRWARSSKYALDAGVSQRRVEIEREKAEMMSNALRAALSTLGLTEDQTRAALAALATNLRAFERPPDITIPAKALEA